MPVRDFVFAGIVAVSITRGASPSGPYVGEVVGRESLQRVGRLHQLRREVRSKRGDLHVLVNVLYSLDGVRKVAIAAHQDGDIVWVVPPSFQHVRGDHDVDALLDSRVSSQFGPAKTHFQIRGAVQGSQEFLLVLVGLRVAIWITENIVIVRSHERSARAQLRRERPEIDVVATAVLFQAVIQVAAVDENGDSLGPRGVRIVSM